MGEEGTALQLTKYLPLTPSISGDDATKMDVAASLSGELRKGWIRAAAKGSRFFCAVSGHGRLVHSWCYT